MDGIAGKKCADPGGESTVFRQGEKFLKRSMHFRYTYTLHAL